LPVPELTAGLVVRYEYQWHRRSVAGATGADKDHPACVVATFRRQGRAEDFVVYLPISHTQPAGDEDGVELPDDAKRKAGLDSGRQWILISEYNLDTWPTDLRQIPNRPGVFHYGHLPPSMFRIVVGMFWDRYKEKRLRQVNRTES
jgi:hypothetical protein